MVEGPTVSSLCPHPSQEGYKSAICLLRLAAARRCAAAPQSQEAHSIAERAPYKHINLDTEIMSGSSRECGPGWEAGCRNEELALYMKIAAIVSVLVTGLLGIFLPLLGRRISCMKADGSAFFIMKAFAAGVILATAFVHILPDAMSTLQDECLSAVPWRKFPFAGGLAMLSALGTMVVELLGTGYFERRHKTDEQYRASNSNVSNAPASAAAAAAAAQDEERHKLEQDHQHNKQQQVVVHLDIVGMHAHAASHSHSHPDGEHGKGHGSFGHSHFPDLLDEDDEMAKVRHIVVSQVLELGIITHSIIIGFSLGVSQSPCTIRPLLGALSFHQFFEGFALGGCISQAGFRIASMLIMAGCFAVTTPVGIGIGMAVSRAYNANSTSALVVEGVFYSISAGILIYMALVNLIAADFLSKRMRCDQRLQVASFCSLLAGAVLMSLVALWA